MLNETRHAILGPVTVVYVDDQIIIVCISTSLLDYPKKPFDWDSYCNNTNGRKAPAYLFQPVSIIILRYAFFEYGRNVYFIIYSMTLTFSRATGIYFGVLTCRCIKRLLIGTYCASQQEFTTSQA
jgi:hypothetical protein